MSVLHSDMELSALKSSHHKLPSMSGALDFRDTDISDDIESLFPKNFGTSTIRRSTCTTKLLQTPNENHCALKAWGKRTFGRSKLHTFDNSQSSDNSDSGNLSSLSPLATTTTHNKARSRIHRRKSLCGLVQSMAAMMTKDDTATYAPAPREKPMLHCYSTNGSEETLHMNIQIAVPTSPVNYLPKAREKSEYSSTFCHGVDDAVRKITGSGLDIISRPDSAEAPQTSACSGKPASTTPTTGVFELPGVSASRYSPDDEETGPLITLVLPPQMDESQCDAYHLYLHELFTFLSACPPSFSVLGIYDASRRVYYLQPPTSFDESIKNQTRGDYQPDEHATKTLPAGLRRFLTDLPTENRRVPHEPSRSAITAGVETEPATKSKLRSDITRILRLLVAHQEEVTSQKLKNSKGPKEAEILRNGIHARLSTVFETIADLLKQLSSEDQADGSEDQEVTSTIPDSSCTEKPDEVEPGKHEAIAEKSDSKMSRWDSVEYPSPTSEQTPKDLRIKRMWEASSCKGNLKKVTINDEDLFMIDSNVLMHRNRVPPSNSDEDCLNGQVRRKRSRALSSTGPFFTGSWRHEPCVEFISPFRAARLGRVQCSEMSEAFTDASDASLEGCSAAILMSIVGKEFDTPIQTFD